MHRKIKLYAKRIRHTGNIHTTTNEKRDFSSV
jgi:hypothetical protein